MHTVYQIFPTYGIFSHPKILTHIRRYCLITYKDAQKTLFDVTLTAWKLSKYGVFSGPYFPVFGFSVIFNCFHREFYEIIIGGKVLRRSLFLLTLLICYWGLSQYQNLEVMEILYIPHSQGQLFTNWEFSVWCSVTLG